MALAIRPELLVSDIGIRGIDGIQLAKPVHPAEMMKQVLARFAGAEMVAA